MTPYEPEALLTHAGFIQALARRLVRDGNDADDLSQQTWLAILSHPPTAGRPVRGWLARVIRNLTFRRHREEQSRRSRESAAAQERPAPSAHDVVSRDEVVRRVNEAVLGLDEPYRETILMRYYENLPPRTIAVRSGIPVETVKTRLKRGIERLRRRLDGNFGTSRESWSLALAPLAGLAIVPAAATTTSTTGTVLSGGWAVSLKAKLAAAGLALVALVLFVVEFLIPPEETVAIIPASTAVLPESRLVIPDDEPDGENVPTAATLLAPEPGNTYVAGRVTDLVTGEPVRTFDMELTRYEYSGARRIWHEKSHKVFHDDEGRFRIDVARGGIFSLIVRAPDHRTKSDRNLEIADGKGLSGYEMQLDPGITVTGTVVDDRTGDPIAGAIVVENQIPNLMIELNAGHPERVIHAITDDQGAFRLTGVYEERGMVLRQAICAWSPDHAQDFAYFDPRDNRKLEIRLEKGFRISGKALDDDGKPCVGLRISLSSDLTPVRIHTVTDESGCYRTLPLRPGIAEIHGSAPPRTKQDEFNFSREVIPVVIVDEDLVVDFGPREDQVVWRGTVFGFDGEPAPGASLNLYRSAREVREQRGMEFSNTFSSKTDGEGRFEFRKLRPGSFDLKVRIGRSFSVDHEETIVFSEPGPLSRDVRVAAEEIKDDPLVYAGTIGGTVLLAETGKPPAGALETFVSIDQPGRRGTGRYCDLDKKARFRFDNLKAGIYDLSVSAKDRPGKELKGIRLFKGQRLDDLELVFPPGGKLIVALTGFSASDAPAFTMRLRRTDSAETRRRNCKLGLDGSYEETLNLEEGKWIVSVTFESRGSAEGKATIAVGESAAITFDRSKLKPSAGTESASETLSIEGSLTSPDGSPLAGWSLEFYPHYRDGLPGGAAFRKVSTDREGLFSVSGFSRDWWRIDAIAPGSGTPIWSHSIKFRDDQPDPYAARFVVPGGKIRGTLCCSLTGRPVDPEVPEIFIAVLEPGEAGYYSGNRCRLRDGRFEVAGGTTGAFRLIIDTPGFRRFESKSILPDEGGVTDVGKLLLAPFGILKLRIADSANELFPPPKAFVFCNGDLVWPKIAVPSSDGFRFYNQLPTGTVPLEIRVTGFQPWKDSVVLEPGRPLELDVMLQPRP